MRAKLSTTLAALLVLAACGDGTGPRTGVPVSLTFASNGAAGGAAAPSFAGPMAVSYMDGTNTLEITSVQVVLREIELEPVTVADCDVEPEPAECQDFETGPLLVDLALDGTTSTSISILIPDGTYDEVEFDVHEVASHHPEDADFLVANPTFEGKSIVVTGTWNGVEYTYETDLNEEQELALVPNLVIGEDAPATNLTIRFDVSTWFVDGAGNLVNPAMAYDGGPYETLVKHNIKASIEAFEDSDHDGHHDNESS